MLTEKVIYIVKRKKKKVKEAKYTIIRLEDCGIIGVSEKKVVHISSLSPIVCFGSVCDSGKKWIN